MSNDAAGGGAQGERPRKSERVALTAQVKLRRAGKMHYAVNVYDVSPEGCRVEFIERPQLAETVWVKFDGLDAIPSSVCWVRGFDVGVEFDRPIHSAVYDSLVRRLTRS